MIVPSSMNITARVAAVARSEWRINVFATTNQGVVIEKEWRPSLGWQKNTYVMTAVAAANGKTAVARNRERVEFFAIADDGSLRSSYRNFELLSDDRDIGYMPATIAQMNLRPWSPLAAVSRQPIQVDVFGLDTQGRIATIYNWWGSAWGAPFTVTPPSDLAISNTSMPQIGAVALNGNRLDVFAGSSGGTVTSVVWEPTTGWSATTTLAP